MGYSGSAVSLPLPFATITDTRGAYQSLASLYWPIAVGTFVVVYLVFGFALVRYRASRPGRPSARAHARLAELAYIVGLAGIAFLLIFVSFNKTSGILGNAQAVTDPATRVNIVAGRWNWRFEYPGGVVQTNAGPGGALLKVPAGQPVLYAARSNDVLHDFWIPYARFQRQVWPDHVERFVLTLDRPGLYGGKCAWFCGLYHANMDFQVDVMPPAQFRAWLQRRQAEVSGRAPS